MSAKHEESGFGHLSVRESSEQRGKASSESKPSAGQIGADNLLDTIRDVIADVCGPNGVTVSCGVHRGTVVLAGVVATTSELDILLRRCSTICGQKQLRCFVTVAPKTAVRSSRRAEDVQEELRKRWQTADVNVSVFGSIAGVYGYADDLQTKRRIASMVQNVDGVKTLVDRVEARS